MPSSEQIFIQKIFFRNLAVKEIEAFGSIAFHII